MKFSTIAFIGLWLLLPGISIAQLSSITGYVSNANSALLLENVSIEIEGTSFKTKSNNNGNFHFNNLPAGEITIIATAISYSDYRATFKIQAGQNLELNIHLTPIVKDIENITITATRRTNTQNAVVLETRESKSVITGISRQQISLSQDGNAAQVMQRIPGVTIIENRFVMIRGLSERYNNVLINNVVAPSTEIDKRTFSFDLIPSSAIDRMIIHKSGAAENPGDFAGGIIKVYTNNIVEKPFTQISIGTGIRTNTTFNNYYQSGGSSTDFLGFDNGYRNLPGSFPTTEEMLGSGRGSELRRTASLKLKNNFALQKSTALPDISLGFSLGRKFKIGSLKSSMNTTVNYTQQYQNTERSFDRYFEFDATRPNELDKRFEYNDRIYEKNNRINILSNWTFIINSKNKIKFSNLFNQIGENETNIRQGEDFIQTLGWRRHYMLGYRNRSIYSGQIEGNHKQSEKKQFNWVVGYSSLTEKEPDLRRFRTYAPNGRNSALHEYIMITPPSSNLFDASRYYGKLNESTINGGTDYTWNIDGGSDVKKRELKLGVYADYRIRNFKSRYLSYLIPGSVTPDRKAELESLPISQIFSPETLSQPSSFVIEEGTRPQDAYEASNFTGSGYISFNTPWRKFTFNVGLRTEYNQQTLNSYQGLSKVDVNNSTLNVLPFLNTAYHLTNTTQLRFAFGRTVNRPEFRELAPFLFYDYKLDANKVGNIHLKTAVIDNIDLRYEFYPRAGETIILGTFFKYFDNPIENKNIITSELPQYTYVNADYAVVYGTEIELRKRLDNIFSHGFLSKLSVNLNAAYIYSKVDLGNKASAQKGVRKLQGQSPYIINGIVSYNDVKQKLIISASYNVFGTRIFSVGDLNNPDIYEMPRHSLDLTITKSFKGFSLKAGIQDILNYKYRFVQDSDRNNKVNDEIDKTIFSYNRGSLYNMSFTINL